MTGCFTQPSRVQLTENADVLTNTVSRQLNDYNRKTDIWVTFPAKKLLSGVSARGARDSCLIANNQCRMSQLDSCICNGT